MAKKGKKAAVTVSIPRALAKSVKIVQSSGKGISVRISKKVKKPSIGFMVK